MTMLKCLARRHLSQQDSFVQWRTQVFFFMGGVLQLDAGRDAAPALKIKSRWAEGGVGELRHLFVLKKLSQFPRHGVGVSSYMADLSDKQASKKKKKTGPRVGGGGVPCVRACVCVCWGGGGLFYINELLPIHWECSHSLNVQKWKSTLLGAMIIRDHFVLGGEFHAQYSGIHSLKKVV